MNAPASRFDHRLTSILVVGCLSTLVSAEAPRSIFIQSRAVPGSVQDNLLDDLPAYHYDTFGYRRRTWSAPALPTRRPVPPEPPTISFRAKPAPTPTLDPAVRLMPDVLRLRSEPIRSRPTPTASAVGPPRLLPPEAKR